MRRKPKQIGNMKKVLSIILTVFCISITSLYTYADNDNSNQCTVQIGVKKYPWQQGIERSMDQYVNAYLYLHSNTIEVEFYGLGEGEIYIVDQNDQIVESVSVWENQNYATLSSPQNSGTYVLVIRCSRFYGEGIYYIR